MKRIFLLSVVLFVVFANASSQRYSINKLKYDYRQYVPEYGDPYNPTVSGLCSFLVPGLGQMLSGETGRGLAFMGGYVGCAIVYGVGIAKLYSSNYAYGYSGYGSSTYNSVSSSGVGTMLLGAGGMLAVSIWSIVDAVHVAKVNNMYIHDMRKTSSIGFEVAPYAETLTIDNQLTTPVGLSMRVTF